jgi:hypothetical protein
MPLPAIMHCIIAGAANIRDADRRAKSRLFQGFWGVIDCDAALILPKSIAAK